MSEPTTERQGTSRIDNLLSRKEENRSPLGAFGLRRGLLAGVLMGIYVTVLQLFGVGDIFLLQALKYIFLGVVLYRALRAYKFISEKGKTFKNGLVLGVVITAVAGLTFVFFHLAAFFIGERMAFEQFEMELNTFPEALVLAGGFFLEDFVAGIILTFVSLQFLKDPAPPA